MTFENFVNHIIDSSNKFIHFMENEEVGEYEAKAMMCGFTAGISCTVPEGLTEEQDELIYKLCDQIHEGFCVALDAYEDNVKMNEEADAFFEGLDNYIAEKNAVAEGE